MIRKWYEIWVDESTSVPYILFVSPYLNDSGEIMIIDPQADNRVIQIMADYQTAKLWLLEDEYTLVDGRMEID